MKVVLYAMETSEGRRAWWSVAAAVDKLYWTDPAFREGVAVACGMVPEASRPLEFVRLKEALPLGMAESACLMLMERWKNGSFGGSVMVDVRSTVWPAGEEPGHVEASELRLEVEHGDGAGASNPVEVREQGRLMAVEARELAERLRGRSLLQTEAHAMAGVARDSGEFLRVLQLAALLGIVKLVPAVAPVVSQPAGLLFRLRARGSAPLFCGRCGSGEAQLRRTPCASCGRHCAYCEACLTMGRCRECGLLIVGLPIPERAALLCAPPCAVKADRWKLSPAQYTAAAAALAFLLRHPAAVPKRKIIHRLFTLFSTPPDPRSFLVWAVTGAGKTEMMFPLLDAVLAAGGKAAIATPRRDVVLELAPRLARAFPHVHQTVLYGGSSDRFEAGDLTIATTHQLIRFHQAFDLIVIDELDAFPYHNDPMLHFAAAKSRARNGTTILLSATPPAELQQQARRGQLACARVPVRHHRRPLPVPRRLTVPSVSRWLERQRIPSRLLHAISTSVRRGAQVFLFVPYIRQIEPLLDCLRRYSTRIGLQWNAVQGTSSQDPERSVKISSFRVRTIRLLVTTTILERGVTVPKSDVIVLDADRPLFDASSLVQMAGRAGRSADDPDGFVYFVSPEWTSSQQQAVKQIKEMNANARKHGYLSS